MIIPFFERSDQEFAAQITGAESCRAEVAKLVRSRRHIVVITALMFLLCVAATLLFPRTGTPIIWIVFLLEALAFQDAQNKLRVLMLAEKLGFGIQA